MKALIMLNKIWNWRLLPDYFQRWLFDTGTRSVELLSSLWLIGFALVFWFDDGAMNVLPTYYKFQAVPEPVLIATLLLLGLLDRDGRRRHRRGFVGICSSCRRGDRAGAAGAGYRRPDRRPCGAVWAHRAGREAAGPGATMTARWRF